MTDQDQEERFNAFLQELAGKFCDCFAEVRAKAPTHIAFTAMTGALAALAVANGFKRNNVIDAINSAFDDIEEQE